MKKNSFILSILMIGLLLVPFCLTANQLPSGKTNKVYSQWEWRDATLQSVASHISAVSGVDIVVDAKIAAEKLTISLKDRTWQDVLKIICHTKNLTYRALNDGSYIYIANEKDVNDRLIQQVQTTRNLETLEDLEKFTIKLKNTTAEEMVAPIRGVLSTRGQVVPVKHTNSIIIHELAKNIETVKMFIDEMDQEMLQISISAKIVEISLRHQNGMGVQWSFFDSRGTGFSHLPTATASETSTDGAGGTPVSSIIGGTLEKATYGILDQKGFAMAMEYLFTNSNSELVAEPQITTLENRQARIYTGSQIPVTQLDESGNTVINMIDVGTELLVTPTVTGQGQIKMDLQPVKKSYELTQQGQPIINEQGAQTNVVVQDGETIVIAGLTSNEQQEAEGGIPFLKDIPIIGYLFKKRTNSNDKTDLVIFVTPHIIKKTKLELLTEEKTVKDTISKDTSDFEVLIEPQQKQNISTITEQE